ncbi:hypothetical protein CDD83_1489 [Cordyceps sp. RAO-2017]|nr:hypothetical protein CDD83_1489 [Cordyceps sp. RAO-2017]
MPRSKNGRHFAPKSYLVSNRFSDWPAPVNLTSPPLTRLIRDGLSFDRPPPCALALCLSLSASLSLPLSASFSLPLPFSPLPSRLSSRARPPALRPFSAVPMSHCCLDSCPRRPPSASLETPKLLRYSWPRAFSSRVRDCETGRLLEQAEAKGPTNSLLAPFAHLLPYDVSIQSVPYWADISTRHVAALAFVLMRRVVFWVVRPHCRAQIGAPRASVEPVQW